jgi:polysaccharide biosynthesis/export protein
MRTILLTLLLGVLVQAQDKSERQFATRDARYRIQPNDVVDIQFRYTPEFNFSATVEPDGYINSQVTGDVHIAGLTMAEAASAMQKAASSRLKDPEVSVLLRDFVKPHIVVAGEVAHPGTLELRGEVGIVQAIAMSGGFKDSAKRSQVVLLRRANAEFAEVKVFDAKKLMDPKGIREDIVLRPDDMLVVPRNRITKIEPYIRFASLGMYGLTMGLP